MWLNQLFSDETFDFEKRCRMRIRIGLGVILLGILSFVVFTVWGSHLQPLVAKGEAEGFIPSFYRGIGFGLIAGGIVIIIRNRRYLADPGLGKKREVTEKDERNRLLGLKCWAYTGYSMFLMLYAGILIGGFVSATVVKVLLAVAAVYAMLLFLFRFLLGRAM